MAAKYDCIAWLYDLSLPIRSWRKRFIAPLRGKILEIGVGTGANLPFYHRSCKLTAIDVSPKMLARARRKKTAVRVDLRVADVQSLPFNDSSFDVVVCTLVFCAVPDPLMGLREARRVLKKGGRLLMIEHVRPAAKPLCWIASILTFLGKPIGEHFDRDTAETVRKAGFRNVRCRSVVPGGIFVRIEAVK